MIVIVIVILVKKLKMKKKFKKLHQHFIIKNQCETDKNHTDQWELNSIKAKLWKMTQICNFFPNL